MNHATARRLKHLYAQLWKADSLGFLRGEATFLRNADARRGSELAILHDQLEALRKAMTARDGDLATLRDELDALRETLAARDDALATLRDELGALRGAVATGHGNLATMENTVTALYAGQTELTRRVTATHDSLDLLKSSLEIPPELRDDFQEWKARNPLPARPLVSVCVATYNRAGLLLERCLPSILAQTYDHFELIIVGDGCTDDTQERLAGIRDPRVRFINLPARGHYPEDRWRRWMVAGTAALNRGLDLARGDFVTHLDDDDEYRPDRLEKLAAFARAHGCDVVWHPFWWQPHGDWEVNEGREFAYSQVTTSSVFYRAWFTKIKWDLGAHWLAEPGDWNRFRRFKYLGPVMMRYPEPLLKHYRERDQAS